MLKFDGIKDGFLKGTIRRILYELLVLLILIGFFWSSWSEWIPNWLEYSVLGIVVFNTLYGIAIYPKAKAIADNYSVILTDNGLDFIGGKKKIHLLYRDLKINKIKRKNDKIRAIYLKTSFDQTIILDELENMDELYNHLNDYLS